MKVKQIKQIFLERLNNFVQSSINAMSQNVLEVNFEQFVMTKFLLLLKLLKNLV